MNQEVMNLFNQQAQPQSFDQIKISISSPGKDPFVVLRRDQEARDDQLPDLQAGA